MCVCMCVCSCVVSFFPSTFVLPLSLSLCFLVPPPPSFPSSFLLPFLPLFCALSCAPVHVPDSTLCPPDYEALLSLDGNNQGGVYGATPGQIRQLPSFRVHEVGSLFLSFCRAHALVLTSPVFCACFRRVTSSCRAAVPSAWRRTLWETSSAPCPACTAFMQ